MERTLILIKPDAINRSLIGEIISRFEKKGLKLVGLKMMQLDEAILVDHYKHVSDKPFFKNLSKYMKSAPVIVGCIEGLDAVKTVRLLCGITKSREALPGTIRGDMAMSIQKNVIHTSDSIETAENEIKRFFIESELFCYTLGNIDFVYTDDELD